MKRKICLFLLFVLTMPTFLFSCGQKGEEREGFFLSDQFLHAVCDIFIDDYAVPSGKGVVIDGEAHILTTAHLLDGLDDSNNICLVFPDGFSYRSQIICVDVHNDLALITAPSRQGLQIATSVNMKSSAYILHPDSQTKVLAVPSLSVQKAVSDTKPQQLLRLDAYVKKGASGAPLVDTEGKIIGIVTARSTDGRYTYAVGREVLKKFLS